MLVRYESLMLNSSPSSTELDCAQLDLRLHSKNTKSSTKTNKPVLMAVLCAQTMTAVLEFAHQRVKSVRLREYNSALTPRQDMFRPQAGHFLMGSYSTCRELPAECRSQTSMLARLRHASNSLTRTTKRGESGTRLPSTAVMVRTVTTVYLVLCVSTHALSQ